jgi:hypothetical protein
MECQVRKAVLIAGLMMCAVAGAGCDSRQSYYATGDIPERDSANITIHRLGDHDEVSHRIPGGYFIDRVVDSWWEDGNDFRLFNGSTHVTTMTEAASYWGYAAGDELRIFFVDEPLYGTAPGKEGLVGAGIRQPTYDYRLLTIAGGQSEIRSFECIFRDFQFLRPDARARALEAEGLDSHPYLVSKYLAGAEAQDRNCRAVKLPPK